MRAFKRSFEMFAIAFILVLSASTLQANSYTFYVDSVSWRNHGDVYTIDHNLWSGDDFTEPAGTPLKIPPYDEWPMNLSAIFHSGDNTLSFTHIDPHTYVGMPNYNSTGDWLSVHDADFVVNLRGGPPDPGYSFTINIGSSQIDVGLGVGSTYANNWKGIAFEDEDDFLILTELSGYSSIGLKIHVDESGTCIPYYWLDPPDSFLDPDDSNWVRLGEATIELPLEIEYKIGISTGTTDEPIPEQSILIDIKPTSCPNPLNVKSKGVLPVAILGTHDFDVTQIDRASIRLMDVAPLRSNLEDVVTPFEPFIGKEDCYDDCTTEGPDGYLDLTMKFKTKEIVGALGDAYGGECQVLKLTGYLLDGTPISGEDVVLIKK